MDTSEHTDAGGAYIHNPYKRHRERECLRGGTLTSKDTMVTDDIRHELAKGGTTICLLKKLPANLKKKILTQKRPKDFSSEEQC